MMKDKDLDRANQVNILGMEIFFVLQGKTSCLQLSHFPLVHLGGSVIPQGKLLSPIGTRCCSLALESRLVTPHVDFMRCT